MSLLHPFRHALANGIHVRFNTNGSSEVPAKEIAEAAEGSDNFLIQVSLDGCTDATACNFDSDATIENGSCLYTCYGCMDSTACDYDPDASMADDCDYSCYGCTDSEAVNFDSLATIDDGSCVYEILGCTDNTACNYNPDATTDDGSCDFSCYGCTDSEALNYDADATIDDGSCLYDVEGCTDSGACNYNPDATIDDGSCEYTSCLGCTDSEALNYDPTALIDDGSCIYDCDYPVINYSTYCKPDEFGVFYIEMSITSLGNGAPYIATNNQNDQEFNIAFTGTINDIGPFDNNTNVVVTVASTVLEDCLITSPLLTYECIPDNIDEKDASHWLIYPNPNNGTFTLQNTTMNGNVSMSVFDMTGRKVYEEVKNMLPGEERMLHLEQLSSGSYMIHLIGDDNQETIPLIIQR